MDALPVRVLDRPEQLRELEPAWDALAARDETADVFGSFDWFFTWWEQFAECGPDLRLPLFANQPRQGMRVERTRLHVIQVGGDARPQGILPLLHVSARWRRMPVRVLMPALSAHAPRSSLLCAPDAPRIMAAALEWLRGDSSWDVLWLDGLARHSFTNTTFERAADRDGLPSASAPAWAHSRLHLDGDWEEFRKARGSHFRKRLARSERELSELGQIRAQCHHGPDAVARAMQCFLDIDHDSWKADLGESIGRSSALGAYYCRLAERMARKDACEVWTLEVGPETAAGFLCLRKGGVLYTLKTSFRKRFSSPAYSTGTVLLSRILEDAFRRKLEALDFVGRMPFSERWTSQLTEFAPAARFRSARFPMLARALSRTAEIAAHWGLATR